MKKDFIKDGKIVRRCDANISKMNIAEYVYYSLFHWHWFKILIIDYILPSLIESLKYLGISISNILILLLSPIMLPVTGLFSIQKAKKICNNTPVKGKHIDKEDFKSKLKNNKS